MFGLRALDILQRTILYISHWSILWRLSFSPDRTFLKHWYLLRSGKTNTVKIYAGKTLLISILNGPLEAHGQQDHISSSFVSGQTTLKNQGKTFWSIEFTDVLLSYVKGMSVIDKKILQLEDDNIKMKMEAGHELPIPFKEGPPPLEDNRQQRLRDAEKEASQLLEWSKRLEDGVSKENREWTIRMNHQ